MLQKVTKPKIIKAKKGEPLKLDLGCGHRKAEGFLGCDRLKFPGVDHVFDVTGPWPVADGSVDEIHSSHMLEHLTAPQRCFFFNELDQVLKPDGKATIIVPHWSTCRAYGD